MTSNIQFVSELATAIPVASAPGKVRLFRDVTDGLLKFKDNTGAVFPIAGAQDYKDAVRVASSTALPAYTRVANTITATLNGALPAQDGVTLILNDSLLYFGGVGLTEKDNGIYVVTQVGNGGLPFILDRRADFATSSQISPGMVVPTGPEGAAHSKKLFILTTPPPVVLNSSGITFETIGGFGFTFTDIDHEVTIPAKQAMLFVDDVVVEDNGDLNLEGDVTPAREEDNYSVNFIPTRSVRVVQENDQMLYTDSMQIDGDLVVDGDIIDATPFDGFDILAALNAVGVELTQLDDSALIGTVQTTNNIPTTLATYATATNGRVIALRAKIIARETTGTEDVGHWLAEVTIKRNSAGVVTVSEDLIIKSFKDNVNWDIQFTVSGTNVLVRVVGDVGNTVEWRLIGSVSEHG